MIAVLCQNVNPKTSIELKDGKKTNKFDNITTALRQINQLCLCFCSSNEKVGTDTKGGNKLCREIYHFIGGGSGAANI